MYLVAKPLQRIPLDAREDVADEEGVEVRLDNLELCIAGVQWESGRRRLAGLPRAREEIEG